jgi:hypothetical protein
MSTASSFTTMSFADFAVAVTFAALLAMGVFYHANKRGNRHATAWGIATFLAAGLVVPFYFVRYWLMTRGR